MSGNGHAIHCEEPFLSAYFPSSHKSHAVAPPAENLPSEHRSHASFPVVSEKPPAAHGVGWVLPAAQKCPFRHGVHSESEARLVASE